MRVGRRLLVRRNRVLTPSLRLGCGVVPSAGNTSKKLCSHSVEALGILVDLRHIVDLHLEYLTIRRQLLDVGRQVVVSWTRLIPYFHFRVMTLPIWTRRQVIHVNDCLSCDNLLFVLRMLLIFFLYTSGRRYNKRIR